jgi:hypothetical protein
MAFANVTGNDADHPVGTNESGIFITNGTGTYTITSTNVSGTHGDNIRLEQSSGTLNSLTVSSSLIGPNPVGTGANGIAIVVTNAAVATVTVNGDSAISGNQASGILTSVANTGQLTLTVDDNDISGNNMGIDIGIGGNRTDFTVTNNRLQNHKSNAMNIVSDATSTNATNSDGTVSGNTVGTAGVVGSGSVDANGIALDIRGGANADLLISDNTVRGTQLYPMIVENRLGNGTTNLTIENNDVGPSMDTFNGSFEGIRVTSRDTRTTCLDIRSNTAVGLNQIDIRVRQADTAVFRIEGLTGSGTDATNVGNFIQSLQDSGTEAAVHTGGTGTIVNYTPGTCSTP